MTAIAELAELTGLWQAENHLWLYPGDPVHLSETRAELAVIAQAQFSELRYTWAWEGEPQEGRLILGQAAADKPVRAVWFDTWHMQNQFMVLEGSLDVDGTLSVTGSYAAQSGPDWGWQISLRAQSRDAWLLRMHNITPEGEMVLAVEAAYRRVG